jgi:glyoxylase-like metal-dependent hydrolase (beta-lactamase superfamily II)
VARITDRIHSLDSLDHPFGMGIVPYIVKEGPADLTLVDTCFAFEAAKLVDQVSKEGYDIKDVKHLILTHTHVDHVQAANEIKRFTSAKIYAHWADAGYLKNDPMYHGPPSHQTLEIMADRLGIRMEDISKKFGSLSRSPVLVDQVVQDGDLVGKLRVIHTPGHTPGHISLYSEEDRAVIGGDFLFKGVLGFDGLFVPGSEVSIDPKIGAISARRVSQLKFDKLLLAHQNGPLLDNGAPAAVEKAASVALTS